MRAAVMYARKDIRIEEVPEPEVRSGELMLAVRSAGICGTDVAEYLHGPSMFPIPGPHPITKHEGPIIPGHEFGGRVVAVGSDVVGFEEGDLVASGAGISCGSCFQCRTGRTNLCVQYTTVGLQRNGALAEYVAVPAAACLAVGDLGLSDDEVALVQPMSVAVHAMRRGRPEPAEDVVVIGVGGIGAFLVHALVRAGHGVVAVDVDRRRLDVAVALGAKASVGADEETAGGGLTAMSPLPRLVYEASGSSAGLDLALEATPPGSRVVAVGLQESLTSLDLRCLTLDERELVGTNAHAFAADFPFAAELVAVREESWADIAPTVLPLEDLVPVAITEMAQADSPRIKTLFDPGAKVARALCVTGAASVGSHIMPGDAS